MSEPTSSRQHAPSREPRATGARPPGRRTRRDHGMTTAEYAVGTLGAATCAAVLVRLGADGWMFDQLREIIVRALDPTTVIELLHRGRPWTPLG